MGMSMRMLLALGVSTVLAAILMWPGERTDPALGAAPGFVPNSALILGSSVVGGTATAGTMFSGGTDTRSLEEEQAQLAGFTTTVVNDTTWSAMTAADFDNYQIIIIGDPMCGGVPLAAIANAPVWQSVVMSSGGNKYLTGTDDELHHVYGTGGAQSTFVGGPGGAARAVKAGVTFAGAVAGATGAYVDLSCDVPGAAGGLANLMDGLSVFGPGQFTFGSAPCSGTVSLVADFPGLAGALTSADLSDWGCSAHSFANKWPADWVPLALATDLEVPDTYSANDISTGAAVHGSPYRLISGSGVTVTSDLALSPLTATNPVGTDHTVTATLTQTVEGTPTPVADATITFAISSGPNAGVTGSCVTAANGKCTFTYTGSGGPGTDTIVGSTIVSGATKAGTASKTWEEGGLTATATATATATETVSCLPPTVGRELAALSHVSVTSTAQTTRTAEASRTVMTTQTAEATDTPTPTDTATPTETATATQTRTSTATPTATCTPTATATAPSRVSTATSTVTRTTVAVTSTASGTAVTSPSPAATGTFTSGVLGAQVQAPTSGAQGAAQLPNTGGGSSEGRAGALLAIAALLAAFGGLFGVVAMQRRR